MAAPIINLTTSVLGYQQWQTWAYQPVATNMPVLWTSTPLPPGLSLNAGTGLLTGAVSVPGVYLVNLVAANVGGEVSAPVTITIGVDPAFASNKSGVDVSIETGTGVVSVTPDIVFKADDDLMLYVTFKKGATVLDLGPLATLQLGFKEFEPDPILVVGSAFVKSGSGSGTVYQLYVKIDSTALTAALSNYEADSGTQFDAICEIEWQEPNASGVGPVTLRRSTVPFLMPVARNINAR
jgi:hypothetical protein